MGVTGLWKLIEQSGKPVPLDTLENKVLAVDISIWLHQVVKGFQDSNGATLPNAHLLGLFHRLCKLLYYRIKPVFVFDGGVPPLKRETMAKRARNKSKYQSEADKLQQLLLESLAKEKVVQQALGPSSTALLTNSPQKSKKVIDDDDDNDMFKLPPIKEAAADKSLDDDSMTDLTESDESFDEKSRKHYNQNLRSIDVTSSYFQSLPADIRHEILSDLKEMRKESSWGRLHELPVESRSFSSFQMNRLLKRRRVQVELEGAEKEMGGKGLSLAELENLLSEKGVVDPEIATSRIASNEHVRFLHVRDVKKAMEREEKRETLKPSPPKIAKIEPDDVKPLSAEDLALQKAIQLSLGCEIKEEGDDEDEANTSGESIKLTTQQRKALGSAATSLARNYMIEYGGMNDEDVADLVKLDETVRPMKEFKYNDDSILVDKGNDVKGPFVVNSTNGAATSQISIGAAIGKKYKDIELSDTSSDEGVSSDADSDFVEVPEIGSQDSIVGLLAKSKQPLPMPFLMNVVPQPDTSKDFRLDDLQRKDVKFEVVIKPTSHSNEEDIFADIFAKPEIDSKPELKVEDNILISSDDEDAIKSTASAATSPADIKPIPAAVKNISSILNDLDKEIEAATKLNLDDILKTSMPEEKIGIDDLLKASPVKVPIADKIESNVSTEQVTPTKIAQPFFVRKTPPSSKKKEQHSSSGSLNGTPSKASKSLLDSFESLPIPSTSAQAASPPDERKTLEMAANLLRENKSEAELKQIAAQISQDKLDLVAERNKKDRMGVSITEQMSTECMDLLRLFGIPYVVAPMEAEAQCAFLNEIKLTDGTITDDSDIWLFGGHTVYKNFFDQNKLVMEFKGENIKKLFHLERNEMIQLSMLVGSDYTPGIHGIGTVTALEVLSLFSATPVKDGETTAIMSILSGLRKFKEWWAQKRSTQLTATLRSKLKNITLGEDFPSARVAEAYLYPTVDENNETFTWGNPELESIREYAKRTFAWTNKKTDEIVLPVMKRMNEKTLQQSIKNYFKVTATESRTDLKVSNRLRKALDQFSMDVDAAAIDDDSFEVVEKKKPKRKTAAEKAAAKESKPKKKGDDPNPKPKTVRKGRKKKPSSDADAMQVDEEPSCSTSMASLTPEKKINLPVTDHPIPQREKDKQILEENKLKAIEVLKKQKKRK